MHCRLFSGCRYLCRTSLNGMGGVPNDNNGLEGTNGTQKDDQNFERFGMTQFIPKFALGNPQRGELGWLYHQSAEDLSMSADMKELGRSNKNVNVWDQKAFNASWEMWETFKDDKHGPFGCRIERTDSAGLKVIDIPSQRILTLLLGKNHRVPDETNAIKLALCHTGSCRGGVSCAGCEDSWHSVYVELMQASTLPQLLNGNFSFDLYMDYVTSFHTLTPIIDVIFVGRLIDRLLASGMQLNVSLVKSGGTSGALDVEKMKKKGFCSCNCRVYLHYLWCVHVCTDALVKGLIVKFPPTYTVRQLGVDHNGRTSKALRGGCLGYQ